MSKTIQAYIDKHPDKFESYHTEDNNERGCDYWVYCREPYFCPDMETQTIHEDTVKETLAKMRRVIKGKYNGHSWEPLKKPDTKIQAYKCNEGKYFFILECGSYTYNSDLFCEYYPTLKAAQQAGFDQSDKVLK